MKFSFNSHAEGVSFMLDAENRRTLTDALYDWHDELSPLLSEQVELIHVRPGRFEASRDDHRPYWEGVQITVKLRDECATELSFFRNTKREIVLQCELRIFVFAEKRRSYGENRTPQDIMQQLTKEVKRLLRSELNAVDVMAKRIRDTLAVTQ